MVQVEFSPNLKWRGIGEALSGCHRAATLHRVKAFIRNTIHYDRSMVRRFCQRVQSQIFAGPGPDQANVSNLRKYVDVRFDPFDMGEVEVWFNGEKVETAKSST